MKPLEVQFTIFEYRSVFVSFLLLFGSVSYDHYVSSLLNFHIHNSQVDECGHEPTFLLSSILVQQTRILQEEEIYQLVDNSNTHHSTIFKRLRKSVSKATHTHCANWYTQHDTTYFKPSVSISPPHPKISLVSGHQNKVCTKGP